jgi:hypothetical protein
LIGSQREARGLGEAAWTVRFAASSPHIQLEPLDLAAAATTAAFADVGDSPFPPSICDVLACDSRIIIPKRQDTISDQEIPAKPASTIGVAASHHN